LLIARKKTIELEPRREEIIDALGVAVATNSAFTFRAKRP
jgi:hypothetical protein